MIKIYVLFILLFFLSCQHKRIETTEKESDTEEAISSIIEAVIIQDSLELTIPVAEELMPFVYFTDHIDAQGNETPPPAHSFDGVHHVNEIMIARNFDYIEQHRLTQLDILHIKEQLLKAKQISIPKQSI